ncbi:MAG: GGDEF domain-containing protein, partial [Bradymonadaceae bacterium]
VAGAVAKIRSDRRRTEQFRNFVHGLLERQARTARLDPLTEVMNRRGFFEQLYVELARWERGGPSFGVIYLD